MPHYADGTEAKVGDQVVGKLYNTPGKRAGSLISITPGVESCNALVQFTDLVPIEKAADGSTGTSATPRMALADPADSTKLMVRTVKGEAHGTQGPGFMAFTCVDYCATNELTKIGP